MGHHANLNLHQKPRPAFLRSDVKRTRRADVGGVEHDLVHAAALEPRVGIVAKPFFGKEKGQSRRAQTVYLCCT